MSRIVPQVKGVFRVFHQNNRFTATQFPRDYTLVATVHAQSPQEAREKMPSEGDRFATYSGEDKPIRPTLPGDVILNTEGREWMVCRDYCHSMPGLTVEPPESPAYAPEQPERGMER